VLIIKLACVSCTRTPLGAGKQTNSIYLIKRLLIWKLPGLLSEYLANFYMHIQVLNLFNAYSCQRNMKT